MKFWWFGFLPKSSDYYPRVRSIINSFVYIVCVSIYTEICRYHACNVHYWSCNKIFPLPNNSPLLSKENFYIKIKNLLMIKQQYCMEEPCVEAWMHPKPPRIQPPHEYAKSNLTIPPYKYSTCIPQNLQ